MKNPLKINEHLDVADPAPQFTNPLARAARRAPKPPQVPPFLYAQFELIRTGISLEDDTDGDNEVLNIYES